MTKYKIGFCGKYKDSNGDKEAERALNPRTATLSHLKKLSRKEAYDYLKDVMEHNIRASFILFKYLSMQKESLRMFRMGSDLFPLYSHKELRWFWKAKDIQKYLEGSLFALGSYSRDWNIRLSFHPGQFTVLNSTKTHVVKNAIAELEYHCDIARFLGYTNSWHENGFACNIHVGSREGGIKNFLKNHKKLSSDCQKILTVENDEYSFGVDDFLELGEEVA